MNKIKQLSTLYRFDPTTKFMVDTGIRALEQRFDPNHTYPTGIMLGNRHVMANRGCADNQDRALMPVYVCFVQSKD